MQDISAERAVLASIYQHGRDSFIDVEDIVNNDSFTLDPHIVLFKIFKSQYLENPDVKLDIGLILSGANSLGLPDFFEKTENVKVLRGITNMKVNKENVRNLAKQIRKLQIIRGIDEQFSNAKQNLLELSGNETLAEIIASAEASVSDYISTLNESASIGPESIGQGIQDYYQHLLSKKDAVVGIPTGFPLYDAAIGGGMRYGSVNVVGARNKVGKSIFGSNVGVHVAGNVSMPVLNLDTEMSKLEQWNRLLASISGLTINDIETGQFKNSPEAQQLLEEAVLKLSTMKYDYLSIAGQSFEETLSVMKRWITKNVGFNPDGTAKPCVIVYDYLKLMSSSNITKNMQEYQVLGFQMTELKNFMNKYKPACLTFVQLNRDGVNVEDTTAVSQSDRIAWLCDNLSILKPKTKEEMAAERLITDGRVFNRKLIPLVARHGSCLDEGDYINIEFIKPLAKMIEGPLRNELHADEEPESSSVEF